MSLIFEMAIKEAAKEAMQNFLYNDNNESCRGSARSTTTKRREHKMTWIDFSDEELKIVNEIEARPGMKAEQIIAFMSVNNTAGVGVTCEANTTKVLLANLVKRKVITASTTQGYHLNDAAPPP